MKLTPRELQITSLLADGLNQRQIAAKLNVNHKIVYAALSQARRKTNSPTDRALLIKYRAEQSNEVTKGG